MTPALPGLESDSVRIERAFRVAVGDVLGNVVSALPASSSGRKILMAGLTYESWTRDAAINVWNGLPAFWPEVSRDTLLEEVTDAGELRGQYWDAVVWVTGAWQHFLWTGDREFLAKACEVSENWIRRMEREERDGDGLFRGPACFQDGISGYGDRYADCGGSSCIADWPRSHPGERADAGAGLPMKCLSTNCLYGHAYALIGRMRSALGLAPDSDWSDSADRLKAAIKERFVMPGSSRLRYYIDPSGEDSRQEGMGYALAVLFDILPDVRELVRSVLRTPAGIPGLWPGYERYAQAGGQKGVYGRHAGLVWPHVQALWAEACLKTGDAAEGLREIALLESHALRDGNYFECYHPETGLPDGGVQEINPDPAEDWHDWCLEHEINLSSHLWRWRAQPRTTWGATGYLRCCLHGYLGLYPQEDRLLISPCLPAGVSRLRLTGLRWRAADLNINVSRGPATRILLDGQDVEFLPGAMNGSHEVDIETPHETA